MSFRWIIQDPSPERVGGTLTLAPIGRQFRDLRRATKKWAARAVGAVLVAGAAAALSLAFAWRFPTPPDVPDPNEPRRHALPESPRLRYETDLRRLSPHHLGVRVYGFVLDTDTQQARSNGWLTVLLDTGATLPLATTAAVERLRLGRDKARAIPVRSFAGALSSLDPLPANEVFLISTESFAEPGAVLTPVKYITPTAFEGVDVIVPPSALAPIGGAVRIDFRQDRFTICESIAACTKGTGWHLSAESKCYTDEQLVGIDARVGRLNGHFMLDLGGVTLISQQAYEASGIMPSAAPQKASLLGSDRKARDAHRLVGPFPALLGSRAGVKIQIPRFWLLDDPVTRQASTCFDSGSLGTEALANCELVLSQHLPRQGMLRCGTPPDEPE
ncbi:MAG: hypothetical protein HRU17_02790 [Polyangiaceae bacterium]|nr:hypothetical protein [Polyangiaceae bacterium]